MLQAKELWKAEEERKAYKMRAMRPVLAGLSNDIKRYAQLNPDSPLFAFNVPSFVFGYPLYDHEEAIQYIQETLEEQGFRVWRAPPSVLMISWMKPAKSQKESVKPPKPGPDYRPFVYDESAFAFLTR